MNAITKCREKIQRNHRLKALAMVRKRQRKGTSSPLYEVGDLVLLVRELKKLTKRINSRKAKMEGNYLEVPCRVTAVLANNQYSVEMLDGSPVPHNRKSFGSNHLHLYKRRDLIQSEDIERWGRKPVTKDDLPEVLKPQKADENPINNVVAPKKAEESKKEELPLSNIEEEEKPKGRKINSENGEDEEEYERYKPKSRRHFVSPTKGGSQSKIFSQIGLK